MKKKKIIDGEKIVFYATKNDLNWDEHEIRWDDISSGNINYIYRIINKKTRESYILKFADNATRVNPDGFLSPDRNAHEAGVLQYYNSIRDDVAPKVFCVNKKKHYFLMEDIVPSIPLREALMMGVMPCNLAHWIASFIVDMSFPLLDILNSDRDVDRPCFLTYSNTLIKITENLVFTFPYYDERHRNVYTKENETFLKKMVCNDRNIQLLSAKMREKFKVYKQSLIHGDLHTGSILVKFMGDKVIGSISNNMRFYVVDAEFGFYGPIAYDVGNALAHLYFAKVYNMVMAENEEKEKAMLSYYEGQIKALPKFVHKLGCEKLKDTYHSPLYNYDFILSYLDDMIKDSIYYCGLEIIRRVVGSAKVPEIESIEDSLERLEIEKEMIHIALGLLSSGSVYL